MKVYKFGGASIATPEALKKLVPIIQNAKSKLIIVVSAYGKTTNALEKVAQAANNGDRNLALSLIEDIEAAHNTYAKELLGEDAWKNILPRLQEYYTEMQWAVDDGKIQSKDYVYDQIVCIGEILSTTLFAAYLSQVGLNTKWLDARDVIRTDANYKDPNVDIAYSTQQAQRIILPLFEEFDIVVSQGFIGSTDENTSTTLGREGSDYSAALFTAMLDGESTTIWKDVEGLYNTDPRLFPNAVKIDEITYYEVIEMAFYGAQVIHPKTIKPLENKNIPLYVKCFLDEKIKGTCIKKQVDLYHYPPLIAVKKNQVLLQIQSRDFSFITEDNISRIYEVFAKNQVKINVIQNSAINLVVAVNNDEDKISKIAIALDTDYKVTKNDNVELLTIRHYTNAILEDILKGKFILLEQKTRNTIRVVVQ